MNKLDADHSRPLAAATFVAEFTLSLRPGALRCTRCEYTFRQHDVQVTDDGFRFVCGCCGLDALEVLS